MKFPENFIWGAAAASYQIEGAAYEDGRGLSVWDQMCRWPGKVQRGDTGDEGCDHYHRYREDVQLMGEIGLQAYRLSIAWPRILPQGIGTTNSKGLDFYNRLIDALLEQGIMPWVTLFHWDYPYPLYCRGGWLNRDSSDWFADYTAVVVNALSDRVTHWMTINEPQCFIGLGHQTGEHAPGLKLNFADVLLAAHHTLLAHGKAVQVIRSQAKTTSIVGVAPVGVIKTPATERPEDIEAARQAMFTIAAKDCWNNAWFADPMALGQYPAEGVRRFQGEMPDVRNGDMEIIHQPLDFYGVNIYQGQTVRAASGGEIEPVPEPPGLPLTAMDWPVTPNALYWGPRFLYERYRLPIVITENGMANNDWVQGDGKVHDPQRIDFLNRYLQAYRRAIEDGVQAKGYFLWSVMDNFEWSFGYAKRFGIIHVDYQTKARTLKDSAHWYRDVISSRGASLRP